MVYSWSKLQAKTHQQQTQTLPAREHRFRAIYHNRLFFAYLKVADLSPFSWKL